MEGDPANPTATRANASLSISDYADSPPPTFLRIGGEQKDKILIPLSLPYALHDFPEVQDMGVEKFLGSLGWDPDNKCKSSTDADTPTSPSSKGIFYNFPPLGLY